MHTDVYAGPQERSRYHHSAHFNQVTFWRLIAVV